MRKFAFITMGPYNPEKDTATFETKGGPTYIYTVRNLAQAETLAAQLASDGVGAIELCGAFGKEGAAAIKKATDGKVAVGYVVHDPEDDALFDAFWG